MGTLEMWPSRSDRDSKEIIKVLCIALTPMATLIPIVSLSALWQPTSSFVVLQCHLSQLLSVCSVQNPSGVIWIQH